MNRYNIDRLKLDYDERIDRLKLDYDERNDRHVLPALYRHLHTAYLNQENSCIFDKEYIKYMYNTYINYNLKNILEAELFRFLWIHPKFIYITEKKKKEEQWAMRNQANQFKDAYLVESRNNKEKLGLDVLKNGTYWPLVISARRYQRLFYVYEGSHRMLSIRSLYKNNLWPEDKKMLCLNIITRDFYELKYGKEFIELKKPIEQVLPFSVVYGDEYNTPDGKEFVKDKCFKRDGASFFDPKKELIKMKIYNYSDLLYANQSMSHWLRDIFWLYKENNEDIIKPSKIINSEDKWNKFIGG